ncbi:MAG TPA: hypothetical protein VFM21_08155 [Terriglobia bacterium]|nr:hypothetical protein [Terriglobia bacterium]
MFYFLFGDPHLIARAFQLLPGLARLGTAVAVSALSPADLFPCKSALSLLLLQPILGSNTIARQDLILVLLVNPEPVAVLIPVLIAILGDCGNCGSEDKNQKERHQSRQVAHETSESVSSIHFASDRLTIVLGCDIHLLVPLLANQASLVPGVKENTRANATNSANRSVTEKSGCGHLGARGPTWPVSG